MHPGLTVGNERHKVGPERVEVLSQYRTLTVHEPKKDSVRHETLACTLAMLHRAFSKGSVQNAIIQLSNVNMELKTITVALDLNAQ